MQVELVSSRAPIVDPYDLYGDNIILDINPALYAYTDVAGTVQAGGTDVVAALRCPVSGALFTQATEASRMAMSSGSITSGGDEDKGYLCASPPAALLAAFAGTSYYTVLAWMKYDGGALCTRANPIDEYALCIGDEATVEGPFAFGYRCSGSTSRYYSWMYTSGPTQRVAFTATGTISTSLWVLNSAGKGHPFYFNSTAVGAPASAIWAGYKVGSSAVHGNSSAAAAIAGTKIGLMASCIDGIAGNCRATLKRMVAWNVALHPGEMRALRDGTFTAWGLAL